MPTVNDMKVAIANGEGEFYGAVNGLEPATTYYYRAYGTNATGTGYGEPLTFTTLPQSCSYAQDNSVNTGSQNLDIAGVVKKINHSQILFYGNIEYYTQPVNNHVITLQFYEDNTQPPASGVYTTVSQYDGNSSPSDFKVKVLVSSNGLYNEGALATAGQLIFIENNNGQVTFTFCDTHAGSYTLNGKFTYVP
jgi:FlaG/FlaF family flagellin (archaellin)